VGAKVVIANYDKSRFKDKLIVVTPPDLDKPTVALSDLAENSKPIVIDHDTFLRASNDGNQLVEERVERARRL
jgi:hypothetical protein